MSSVDTEYTAILTRWHAQLPATLPSARRDYTLLGGPPFNRPQLPSPGSITTANRTTQLQSAMWIRLDVTGIRSGARPIGIDPTCKSRRVGIATQILYYPLGYGLDWVLPVVDTLRAIFHRQSLSSGLVQFRDAEAPDWVSLPDDMAAGWGRVDLANSYWVTEVV